MRTINFVPKAFDEFMAWEQRDKKMFRRLARLLDEVRRTPFDGTGKPEPLKGNLRGYWSRRIDDEHRLVYEVSPTEIKVISCYGHYV
jgi:toxin YoeB